MQVFLHSGTLKSMVSFHSFFLNSCRTPTRCNHRWWLAAWTIPKEQARPSALPTSSRCPACHAAATRWFQNYPNLKDTSWQKNKKNHVKSKYETSLQTISGINTCNKSNPLFSMTSYSHTWKRHSPHCVFSQIRRFFRIFTSEAVACTELWGPMALALALQ